MGWKEKRKICKLLKKYKKNDHIVITDNLDVHESLDLDLSQESNVIIDDNFISRNNVSIRSREDSILEIGKNVFFNNNCVLTCRKKIIIGDGVIIGPNVSIFDHDHDYKSSRRQIEYICEEIIIGDNVWIGANACILKGVTIGENSVIAAGTVVSENVDKNTIYFGKNQTKKIVFKTE